MKRFFALVLVLLLVAGCGEKPSAGGGSPVKLSTGQVIDQGQLIVAAQGAMTSSTRYAVVSRQALLDFYPQFRAELFAKGIVNWDGRYKCTAFTTSFVARIQEKFFIESFHLRTEAQTLAIGAFWYTPGGPPGEGHALVAAITERGLEFFEPQTGKFVELSPVDRAYARGKIF